MLLIEWLENILAATPRLSVPPKPFGGFHLTALGIILGLFLLMLNIDMPADATGYELLEAAGRKRGFLMARAEVNTERMAKVLLDEYRSGKLGKFTLEMPPKEEHDG